MKRLALLLCTSLVGAGCAAQLAMAPPADSFVVVDSDVPELTKQQQELVEDFNKELKRLGLPTARPGSYEMNAAAVLANVGLSRVWYGSSRDIAQPEALTTAAGQPSKEVAGKERARTPSLFDEEDDSELKHVHREQHLAARGLVPDLPNQIVVQDYAVTKPIDSDLRKIVLQLRPTIINGELRIGVADLPAGDANKRVLSYVLRDRVFDLTRGPPRSAQPGSSFVIAGKVYNSKIPSLSVGIFGPSGKTRLYTISRGETGEFSGEIKVPDEAGVSIISITALPRSLLSGATAAMWNMPIFVGAPLGPWPAYGDPKNPPTVDGTRSLAQLLAKAISDFRKAHGLPAFVFDVTLSAYAKSEAQLLADAYDKEAGEMAGTPLGDFAAGANDRLAKAGLSGVQGFSGGVTDDYAGNFLARFPGSAFEAALLGSPTAVRIGLGVTLAVPKIRTDTDSTWYFWDWVVEDRTPPSAVEIGSLAPQPSVMR